MITPEQVREVGRTARPCAVGGVQMDINYVVKHTTRGDWHGDLYELGDTAAAELAAQFNAEHGLTAAKPTLVRAFRDGRRRNAAATA